MWSKVLGTLIIGSTLLSSQALGATFNVSKVEDTNDGICDDDCSLREAVIAANNLSGMDNILLPEGIYTLSNSGVDEDEGMTGDLDITDSVAIIGEGFKHTVINGLGQDRVFHIFQEENGVPPVSFGLQGVTLRNGKANFGAGLYFSSDGLLRIENSLLTKNDGGAIEIRSRVGTWYGTDQEMELIDSIIVENCGSSGVGVDGDGQWLIHGTTIGYNGGWFTSDQGEVSFCEVSAAGGGIFQNAGSLHLSHSSIINNIAKAGAGIAIAGSNEVTITNTLIANNETMHAHGGLSWTEGGAIRSGADLHITDSVIVNNSSHDNAGGIYMMEGYSIKTTLVNTILANNTDSQGASNCVGEIISGGQNMVDEIVECDFTLMATDLMPESILGELIHNGDDRAIFLH